MTTANRSGSRRRRFTVEEYMHLDDGKRWEVIDGELLVAPSHTLAQASARMALFLPFVNHVRRRRLGEILGEPFDVVLGPYDVVQPDFLFVSTGRARILADNVNCKGAPDLMVEILGPVTRERDLGPKRTLYERSGVPHYWIVDPKAREIVELVLEGGKYRERTRRRTGAFRPALFPGLAIPVAAVFRGN